MNGFSLVECLISLAILGIIISSATSGLAYLYESYESEQIVEQLARDLQFARQQALLRQNPVILCPSSNAQDCNEEVWEQGYMVLLNNNKSLYRKIDTQGKLSNSRTYIQFDSDGRSETSNSTFLFESSRKTYKVIINRQGRIRVE